MKDLKTRINQLNKLYAEYCRYYHTLNYCSKDKYEINGFIFDDYKIKHFDHENDPCKKVKNFIKKNFFGTELEIQEIELNEIFEMLSSKEINPVGTWNYNQWYGKDLFLARDEDLIDTEETEDYYDFCFKKEFVIKTALKYRCKTKEDLLLCFNDKG